MSFALLSCLVLVGLGAVIVRALLLFLLLFFWLELSVASARIKSVESTLSSSLSNCFKAESSRSQRSCEVKLLRYHQKEVITFRD